MPTDRPLPSNGVATKTKNPRLSGPLKELDGEEPTQTLNLQVAADAIDGTVAGYQYYFKFSTYKHFHIDATVVAGLIDLTMIQVQEFVRFLSGSCVTELTLGAPVFIVSSRNIVHFLHGIKDMNLNHLIVHGGQAMVEHFAYSFRHTAWKDFQQVLQNLRTVRSLELHDLGPALSLDDWRLVFSTLVMEKLQSLVLNASHLGKSPQAWSRLCYVIEHHPRLRQLSLLGEHALLALPKKSWREFAQALNFLILDRFTLAPFDLTALSQTPWRHCVSAWRKYMSENLHGHPLMKGHRHLRFKNYYVR